MSSRRLRLMVPGSDGASVLVAGHDLPAIDADRLWGWFADAWSRHFGVEVAPGDRRPIEIAISAFHTVSYVGLVATIEPPRQVESEAGITQFVAALDRAVRS